jgi:hypothetical protein
MSGQAHELIEGNAWPNAKWIKRHRARVLARSNEARQVDCFSPTQRADLSAPIAAEGAFVPRSWRFSFFVDSFGRKWR